MDEEQKKQFENDCAAFLELAQEIAVKHKKPFVLAISSFGVSVASGNDFTSIIGYNEPFNKAIIAE